MGNLECVCGGAGTVENSCLHCRTITTLHIRNVQLPTQLTFDLPTTIMVCPMHCCYEAIHIHTLFTATNKKSTHNKNPAWMILVWNFECDFRQIFCCNISANGIFQLVDYKSEVMQSLWEHGKKKPQKLPEAVS